MLQDPKIPSPVGRGWAVGQFEGPKRLVVQWMEGKPAPDAILELLSCNCTTNCTSLRYVCVANGLHCKDMCRLQSCDNQPSADHEDDDSMELQNDEDNDEDYD